MSFLVHSLWYILILRNWLLEIRTKKSAFAFSWYHIEHIVLASRLLVASWNQFVILWKRYIEIIWLFPKKRKKVTNKAEHNTRPFIKRYSISSLYNRPFARWRRFTTTSYRILPGFSFLCKLVLAFWMNIVTLLPMKNF